MILGVVLALAVGWPSESPTHGFGLADLTKCRQAGRTISEDFYIRVYVRSCPYSWDAATERHVSVAGAPQEYVHFKASARCSDEEWLRRVVIGRESRSVCQHRGGEAVAT